MRRLFQLVARAASLTTTMHGGCTQDGPARTPGSRLLHCTSVMREAAPAADLVRSLKFSSSGEPALADDSIISLDFQSAGDCAGCRLDRELEVSVVRGGCASI